MPLQPTYPLPDAGTVVVPNRPTISWAAVFAGMITAIAIQLGLAQLCIAVGLAMYTPFDPGEPTARIAMGTIIAWVVCALLGLFAGGWVAGRLAHYQSQVTAGLHGVLVWATGAVVASVMLATSLGMIASGTAKVAGESVKAVASGVQAAGSTAASGVAAIAAPSWDAVRTQVQDGASRLANAAQDGAKSDTRYADQSRMMDLFGKFFTTAPDQRLNAADKEELTTLVSSQLGISREAAVKTMDQWQRSWEGAVAKYEAVKEDAKQKAKEAAITAKEFTASAAGASFGLMLVGLIAAALGGVLGSSCFRRDEYHTTGGLPTRPVTA